MTGLRLSLTGICLKYDFRALILTGNGVEEVAALGNLATLRARHGQRSEWSIAARGEIDLHLGVALFDRPFVFTPTHIITERQQTIAGEAMFDWLVEGGYRMPRSEVFGIDAYGSQDAQVFARDIDIEESPIAMFGDGTWIVAVVEIDPTLDAEVRVFDRLDLPQRFRKALKCYWAGPNVNLEQWLVR